MFIKQLSVFVENSQGRLQQIIDALGEAHVNIRALSIADTTEFGILRLIVDDIDKAGEALREKGVVSKVTDVIAVSVDDRAGGLGTVTRAISDAGINIEYMYALATGSDDASIVIKTADLKKAAEVLSETGVELISAKELEN